MKKTQRKPPQTFTEAMAEILRQPDVQAGIGNILGALVSKVEKDNPGTIEKITKIFLGAHQRKQPPL